MCNSASLLDVLRTVCTISMSGGVYDNSPTVVSLLNLSMLNPSDGGYRPNSFEGKKSSKGSGNPDATQVTVREPLGFTLTGLASGVITKTPRCSVEESLRESKFATMCPPIRTGKRAILGRYFISSVSDAPVSSKI